MEQAVKKEEPKTVTDYARAIFKGAFLPIAVFLNRLGIKPNTITILGLVGHVGGAVLAALGYMTWAGLLLLVMAPFDFLDGTMARLRGESSNFGAFVDSVTDRYSEFFILGGLLVYFLEHSNREGAMLVYLAAAGSLLVSYIRGRAEALGYDAKIGILSRLERYIVLIPGLVFNIPVAALWVIAVLSNVTAVQRILHVRRQAHAARVK